MPAARLHLVRHGEVHNPGGVIYERLPNFHLSDRGHEMAKLAAEYIADSGRTISALYASPLLRAQESAAPVATAFELNIETDERLIEPYNLFKGRKLGFGHILLRPHLYYHLRDPKVPTWGEPYQQIADRMLAAMDAVADEVESGDAVLVSHQLAIWMAHLAVARLPFAHNPRNRRCALSSVTAFEKRDGVWFEVGYADPGAKALSVDKGAV